MSIEDGEHRYPSGLRERVVAYLEARRAEGVTTQTVGDEFGMDWRTLGRWLRGEPVAGFERVVVREDDRRAAVRVVVHGPVGLRIEGLDLGLLELIVVGLDVDDLGAVDQPADEGHEGA